MSCPFCSADSLDCFREDYTHEELQRGERMVYHPVTGETLASLHYDPASQEFYSDLPLREFDIGRGHHYYRPAIGTGRGYLKGQPYPKHWIWDPVKRYLLWIPC